MKPCLLIYALPEWITHSFGFKRAVLIAGLLCLIAFLSLLLLIVSKRKTRTKKIIKPSKKQKRNVSYDAISATIQKQNGRMRCLLLAATSLKDLPVTIPVNVALRIARTHRCLLVDMDVRRNAVARVFDLETIPANGTFKMIPCTTPIDNLCVWPARNFELLRQMNLRLLLEDAAKKYDYVLIYAPYLTTLPDRRQVAMCAKQAIAFTGKNGSRLMQLLEQCNCKVVEEI